MSTKSITKADRAYVLRACDLLGLDLIAPTRVSPGILAYAEHPTNRSLVGALVVDANDWTEAKAQINKYSAERVEKSVGIVPRPSRLFRPCAN